MLVLITLLTPHVGVGHIVNPSCWYWSLFIPHVRVGHVYSSCWCWSLFTPMLELVMFTPHAGVRHC